MKALPVVPRLRILKRMFKMVQNPIPYFEEYNAEFGDTYMLYMGGMDRGIVSSNPDFIQHILQKKNKNYPKSHIQTDLLAGYVGLGLLTSDGDYWLRQRRLIQPGFHRQKLAALVEIMQAEIEKSCAHFEQKAQNKTVFDINEVGMELAFKVVAKSLFGSQIEENTMNTLADNITTLQEFIIQQIRLPFKKPWFHLTGQVTKHKKMGQESADIIKSLIEKRRASGQSNDDLLDMLLSVRYEDTNEGMTDQQLVDEALILFVAGHETTANAIAWIFYLLQQHPEVVEKLRKEFDGVLGDGKPTFENLRQLEYTTQVINESMRLYPPAWITDRVALEDDEVNGYSIKKGDMVVAFFYGLHHSNDLWDEPKKFKPERFAKARKKERHPYSFLPFGGGPRLCIGNNFAMMEMQMILVHLIQKYDFEMVKNQKIELQPMVTLRPKEGIKMSVRSV